MTQTQTRTCRHCGKALTGVLAAYATNPAFPFCSKRCRMADLDKWFTGSYSISQGIDELTDEQREEILSGEIPVNTRKEEYLDDDGDEPDSI